MGYFCQSSKIVFDRKWQLIAEYHRTYNEPRSIEFPIEIVKFHAIGRVIAKTLEFGHADWRSPSP